MQRSSAIAFGFQVPSGVRLLKGRLGRVVASAAAFVVLSIAVGLQPVVEYRDLTCPPGTAVRYVSIAYWAVVCAASESSTQASSVPTSRYVGLYLTNLNVRVFSMDFLAGSYRGPGVGLIK